MNRFRLKVLLVWTGLGLVIPAVFGQTAIDLAGPWRFAIDRTDQGISERWFEKKLEGTIRLPGSMTENGQGDDVSLETRWTGSIIDRSWFDAPVYAPYRQPGNIKVPFWLNPVKTYVGAAWYQREVQISSLWKDRRIELFLERCHWETRLWVDGREVGMRNSLATPHVYDLTPLLPPGPHQLTIRIDNRIKDINVGADAHSVSDHTQTNWNGAVGRLVLNSGPPVFVDDLRTEPDPANRSVKIAVTLRNLSGQPARGSLGLRAQTVAGIPHRAAAQFVPYEIDGEETRLEVDFPLGLEAPVWDEFEPSVFELTADLRNEAGASTELRTVRFGLREFKAAGTRFAVNGRPVFLRGTLECAIFPKTGYPPTRKSEWLRIFGVIKEHGLNHVRFHSWCPPAAAFDAADETGVYLNVECGAWATVGDGAPIDKWIYEESERIVRAYGNHPSFVMMSYGNEPSGQNANSYLAAFVSYWKAKDARRLYTTAAGWPLLPVSDFHLTPEPRIQKWGDGLKSVINRLPPQTLFDFRAFVGTYDKPVVGHEIGQWCVYPNFKEIPKYTGVLKAKNFEIFRDSLTAAGMGDQAERFLNASGRLQVLCYKADIEAALRTPGFAGFELLDLHDFPGQGTALVGVLDAFWEEKGYVSAAEFRRFCGPTVPLARMAKTTFTTDEKLVVDVEAAHFDLLPIPGIDPEWAIGDASGRTVAGGKFDRLIVPWGNNIRLGSLDLSLETFAAPAKYTLAVRLGSAVNSWNFWVYPPRLGEIKGAEVRVVRRLDPETASFLQGGGRVILTAEPGSVRPEKGGDVALGFSSIFWNTAWTSRQPPHTLGLFCDPRHQALAAFPTEYHTDNQWWDAIAHAQAILLSDFGPGFRPIVRIIDDWVTNRPLGLVFEARVGKGHLIVTGIDLLTDADKRPEARQLLHSLKAYAAGEYFLYLKETTVETIRGLFK